LAAPPGIPPGHQLVSLNGMHVLIPPGTPLPPGAIPIGGPPAVQMAPGFQLPPAPQPPPGHPPVMQFVGQPGVGPPPMGPGPGPLRPEDQGDFVPPPGPGGPWGGPPPHGPPPGPYGRGPGRGEGVGGPQRHGWGGRGGRGGPYHVEGHGGGRGGAAPWKGSTRVCKFYNSTRGCSKGDKCDFRHLVPGSDVDVREQGP
jgi:hypothetical protein